MNTKLFTGLAIAAALFIGSPVYAHGGKGHGGGGHHVAAHHSSGAPQFASAHRSRPSHSAIASRHTVRSSSSLANVAFGGHRAQLESHSFVAKSNASRGYNYGSFSHNNSGYSRASNTHANYAFGGSTHVNNYTGNTYGGNHPGGHGTYAFASHDGWNSDQHYYWHGHHYGWYDGGWYIIDPGYGYSSVYYGNGGSVSTQVQAALQQQGYYQGPIDGIVGPGTSAAIATYQRNNGLRVTGTITNGLLANLGIG